MSNYTDMANETRQATIKYISDVLIKDFIDDNCKRIDMMDTTIMGESAKQNIKTTMKLFKEYLENINNV